MPVYTASRLQILEAHAGLELIDQAPKAHNISPDDRYNMALILEAFGPFVRAIDKARRSINAKYDAASQDAAQTEFDEFLEKEVQLCFEPVSIKQLRPAEPPARAMAAILWFAR